MGGVSGGVGGGMGWRWIHPSAGIIAKKNFDRLAQQHLRKLCTGGNVEVYCFERNERNPVKLKLSRAGMFVLYRVQCVKVHALA